MINELLTLVGIKIDGSLARAMGKDYLGISGNTFVVSVDGTIKKIYKKVKLEVHATQILSDLS